jgi:TonB family protein
MKNILMGVVALTAAYAAFTLLPAQEPAAPQMKVKTVKGAATPVSSTPVTGAPYSAVAITETTQTMGDGNRIVQSRSQKVYRDSQGRERSEGSEVAPDGAVSATISDPVAKVGYTLIGRNHTAVQTPLMNLMVTTGNGTLQAQLTDLAVVQAQLADLAAARALAARTATNATEAPVKENLSPQNLEGVMSNGTRTTITIPAGQVGNERAIHVVDEVWYSPDLQVNVKTVHSDPRSGETVYRLTQIIRAEPDPRLFQVPSDYTMTGGGGGRSGGGGGGRGVAPALAAVPAVAGTVARPGSSVTVITKVEPQYSEEARQAKWQGTVVLGLTVDETGVPRNISVVKPLGMGLDQNAIAAVSQWRFQPTLLNGVPTKVQTQIEVSFKLQ